MPGDSASSTHSAGSIHQKNVYGHMEWAGAFGDIGTLIPFIVAYITIVGVDPLGLLFMKTLYEQVKIADKIINY